MKKESKLVIVYMSLAGTIYAINYLIRIAVHPAKVEAPIYYMSGSCVAMVFLLGYLLYSWKSDMHTFVKRILLSIPFALSFLLFIRLMGYGNPMSMLGGLCISLLLLVKTPDWRWHCAAILIPMCALVILLKFVVWPLLDFDESMKGSLLRITVAITSVTPILSFLLLYISRLVYASTLDFRAVILRSIKFSIVVSMFLTIYLVLHEVSNRLSLQFPVALLLNALLAISFLATAYKYDLLLLERKKCPKKRNRCDELEEDLERCYLHERGRLRK